MTSTIAIRTPFETGSQNLRSVGSDARLALDQLVGLLHTVANGCAVSPWKTTLSSTVKPIVATTWPMGPGTPWRSSSANKAKTIEASPRGPANEDTVGQVQQAASADCRRGCGSRSDSALKEDRPAPAFGDRRNADGPKRAQQIIDAQDRRSGMCRPSRSSPLPAKAPNALLPAAATKPFGLALHA